MQGFAGVIVVRDNFVLLIQEPDFFSGELRWSFPSGHVEPGESPEVAASRELAEEAGCIIDPAALDLVLTADVRYQGEMLSRSWNYTAVTTDSHLQPSDPDEYVRDAQWFDRTTAIELITQGAYPPKCEPAIGFLSSDQRDLHWTFDLVDLEVKPPTFRWERPVRATDDP